MSEAVAAWTNQSGSRSAEVARAARLNLSGVTIFGITHSFPRYLDNVTNELVSFLK